MRHPKLPGLLLLASAIALTGCTDSSSDDAPKPDYRLAILHINDHHSNLDESDASLRLRTGSDDTRSSVPIKLGGFPRVATAMAELSARHDNVLKLHAGDAITGALYYTLSEGEADAACRARDQRAFAFQASAHNASPSALNRWILSACGVIQTVSPWRTENSPSARTVTGPMPLSYHSQPGRRLSPRRRREIAQGLLR